MTTILSPAPETGRLGQEEALRIAQDLASKYGTDAITFIHSCVARANEIDDELAHASLRVVLAALRELLDSPFAERAAPALTGAPSA
jgi:hypothetical protein